MKLPKNEQKTDNSNKYIMIFNKKKHVITFEVDEKKILFTVLCQNKNKKNIYYLHQSKLDSLRENSKILQLYSSPQEIIELFNELFKNKKIYLEYNNYSNELEEEENYNDNINKPNNKELFLIIKLNILMKEEVLLLPLEKRDDINQKFIYSHNNTENEESEKEIEDLSSHYMKLKQMYNNMVKNHDKEINQFNLEIQELKKQNNDLKQKISILLEQVNQLNNLITKNNNYRYPLNNIQNLIDRIEILEELKEESTKSSKKNSDGINIQLNNIQVQEQINIKKLKKCFKSSTILTNEIDFDFLLNKLSKFNPTSYKIIYKSSIDGDNIKFFHSNCDGEENVLIIIETINGLKFGGFTSIGFDSSGYEIKDNNAFLFSINKQKIYDIIPGNNAIFCNRNYGPIFCAKDNSSSYSIFVPDGYLNNKSTTTKNCFCYKMEENFEINNGKKEFLVKELEVFRVDNY